MSSHERPQVFDTAQGRRLNVAAIADQFTIKPWVFRQRQQRGWPQLDGKKLKAEKMHVDGEDGAPCQTFLESEVAAVLNWKAPPTGKGWIDNYTWRDGKGRIFRTGKGANLEYGLIPAQVATWGKRACLFLNGEMIETLPVNRRPPRQNVTITVYLDDHLSLIKERRRKATAAKKKQTPSEAAKAMPRHRDEQGAWLTRGQIFAHYKKGEGGGFGNGLLNYWTKKTSTLRPAQQALRTKTIPNPCGPRPTATGFMKEDLDAILAGKESPKPSGPRGKLRVPNERAACQVLKSLLAYGPKLKSALVEEARQKGVAWMRLYGAKKALNVRGMRDADGVLVWCLPGQTPPTLSMPSQKRETRGPKSKKSVLERQEFCYVEYRLKDRKRSRVQADAIARFGKKLAPKDVCEITIYANRFARTFSLPKRPTEAQRLSLLARADRRSFIPADY